MFQKIFRAGGLAAIAALLLASCNTYPTLAARTAMLSGNAQYYAPPPASLEAPGRAPLVILVSGCGGLVGLEGPKTVMSDYAAAANRAGAYAVVVDSFGSRGMDFETAVKTTCSGLRLRGNARAGDILAAEVLAEKHWNIDFSAVIVAGWSHGGWTVMELLSAGRDARYVGNFRVEKPAPRALTPDAVALFYPYCGFLNTTAFRRWDFKGPLLLLTAGLDNRSPPEQCVSQVEDARGGKENIEAVNYAEVTHAFDESDQIPGSEFRYDPEAAARALFQRFVVDEVARLN
ncbi:MAG: dienelactone hydrolase family protein [Hyphomonadaceae bacterium]|nr:dienelactone hydrolase family protein [Hyphomonadaceae bacterium]